MDRQATHDKKRMIGMCLVEGDNDDLRMQDMSWSQFIFTERFYKHREGRKGISTVDKWEQEATRKRLMY